MPPRLAAALVVFLLAGCATGLPAGARRARLDGYAPMVRAARAAEVPPPADEVPQAPLAVVPGAREEAVRLARSLVGKTSVTFRGKRYGDDCTGLVRGVYEQVGVDLMQDARPGDNGVTAIWRFAAARGHTFEAGHPVAGDLVFYRDTYDRNRDGRGNDGLTHIGLVESVEEDDTVVVIHRIGQGVVRYRMNLAHKDSPQSPGGRTVNDWLRAPGTGTKPRLAAQLFSGYATLLPLEPRLAGR